jgi:hypothetical protein
MTSDGQVLAAEGEVLGAGAVDEPPAMMVAAPFIDGLRDGLLANIE